MQAKVTLGARKTNADLYAVLANIKASNDRIAANSMSMSKYLEAHTKNLQQTESFAQASRLQTQATGQPERLVTKEALITKELQDKFDRELKQTKKGGLFADLDDKQLEDKIAREIASNATKAELTRATGAQKLQGLNIRELATPAGIARRVAGTFGLEGLLGGAKAEPQEDLIGDALKAQRAQTMRRGLGDRTAGVLGSGAAMRGGVRGATAGLGARLALGAIPFVGQAFLVTELLHMLGIGVPTISQLGSTVRGMRQSGALTGEGVQAGFRAQMDARALRAGGLPFAGLNPFDPITDQIATQIVESVRTAGFTGDRARELYGSVASVYRDLGLSVEQTTKMIADATRVGGESLKQIVSEMKTFDEAAKTLGMNINDYAASVQQTADKFRAGGAGASATTLAQQFVAGAPRQMREGAGLAQYTAIFDAAKPFLASQLGMPAHLLQLEQNAPMVAPAFEQAMLNEIARMPGADLPTKAANAAQYGQLFRGQSVDDIMAIIERVNAGRGPVGQARIANVSRDYNTAVGGLMKREVRVGDVYKPGRRGPIGDILEKHGIDMEEYQRIQGLGAAGKLDETITVSDMGNVNRDALAHQRLTAINRLRDILTPKQRGELQRHLRERGYNFEEKLESFTGQGKQVGDSVSVNGIEITLKGAAKKNFRLEANQNQVRKGLIPSNQSYPSEDFRLDPFGANG
jgi:hypothetical protein